jgi:fluoride ion exporter CrcB/FEX
VEKTSSPLVKYFGENWLGCCTMNADSSQQEPCPSQNENYLPPTKPANDDPEQVQAVISTTIGSLEVIDPPIMSPVLPPGKTNVKSRKENRNEAETTEDLSTEQPFAPPVLATRNTPMAPTMLPPTTPTIMEHQQPSLQKPGYHNQQQHPADHEHRPEVSPLQEPQHPPEPQQQQEEQQREQQQPLPDPGEWSEFTDAWDENVVQPGRKALHAFFYPPVRQQSASIENDARIDAVAASSSSSSILDVEHANNNKHLSSDPSRRRPLGGIKIPASPGSESMHLATRQHRSLDPRVPPQIPPRSTATTTAAKSTVTKSSGKVSISNIPQQALRRQQQMAGTHTPDSARSLDSVSSLPNTIPKTPQFSADNDAALLEQEFQDRLYVERFWTAYDDIVILSLFSQLGIICRLVAAYWFRYFDGVFTSGRALFTALPLNCLSCFMMGMLSSGESLMEVIATRFTPPRLQQEIHRQAQDDAGSIDDGDELRIMLDDMEDYEMPMGDSLDEETPSLSNKHRTKRTTSPRRRRQRAGRGRLGSSPRTKRTRSKWKPPHGQKSTLQDELREVQLLALERRIRSSPCLLLYALKKEDVDVVEDYFNDGFRKNDHENGNAANHHHLGNKNRDGHRPCNPQFGYRNNLSMDEEKVDEEQEIEQTRLSFEETLDYTCEVEAGFSFEDYDLALEEEVEGESEVAGVGLVEGAGIRNRVSDFDSGHEHGKATPVSDAAGTTPEIELPPGDALFTPPPSLTATEDPPEMTLNPTIPRGLGNRGVVGQRQEESNYDPDSSRSVPDSEPSTRVAPIEEGRAHAVVAPNVRALQYDRVSVVDYGNAEHPDLDQIITTVATGVTNKISRISRVSLADGWDVGTSPEEMSKDLMLGLRVGLCGAISSFSTWISSMVDLFRVGHIGEAIVGLVIGVQLPIVSYRFGQHVAVYIFIWRCRRESRRDERRGYGIRVSMDDQSEDEWKDEMSVRSDDLASSSMSPNGRAKGPRTVQEEESEVPSVRAIVTAIFIMCLVAQVTSLSFFYKPEDRQIALSLLFSPLGVLTRWRLSRLNTWRPNFPIGTFMCNVAACALAGTLGDVLSGNPGPREKIVLVSVIAGLGGSLSSVAGFIIEVLAGMDPILFRMDGVYYAVSSIFWGLMVSFIFTASVDWADDTS